MQKEKLHINAAETVDTEQPKPAGTSPDDKVVYQKQSTDPETKERRKRSIIRWVISLTIIGLLIFLIVWSCTPKYRHFNPKKVTVDGTSLQLYSKQDATQPSYVVNMANLNNSWAYYYASGHDFTKYAVHANPTNADVEIEFYVIVQAGESGDIYNIGGTIFDTGADYDAIKTWMNVVAANASVQSTQTSIGVVLLNMLPTIIFLVIIIWYFSKITKMSGMMGQGEDSIFGMGKSSAKIAKSAVKFSDVAGIEEEKNELIEIVDYLKNPEKYAAMGARTPRGVILYGPPGTGKTLLAKAVAGEASVPFFQASGSSFDDMLVGVGAKRVRDLFTRAKKAAPSIIFIDEIDSVAGKRGRNDIAGGSGGIADQTINQLLAEMDGFNTRTGVVIMAATNRLDSLDEAILRPGRFDRHIQVNLPDIKEREAILKIHARNKNLSSKVSLGDVARRTPGFSGAQLENVLNEATLLAVRLGKTAIGMSEIDEAIDRVIAGPAKHSRVITDEEKRQIAYHEAGHALVGLHTKGGDVVEKITIIPRGVAAGYTLSTPEKQELAIQKKSDLLAIVRTTLGGRAAEEVVYGKDAISTGASNDLYKVTNIVKSMVTQLGMSSVGMTQFIPTEGSIPAYAPKSFSEQTNQKIDKEIEEIIQTQYAKAKDVIKHNSKELDLIVETLLILETIVKNQIDYIHKELKLPPEAIEKKKALEAEKKDHPHK
ncbi:MAG: ATP-dependent zinc metalloprotease FtsH [Mycoplasmoidaceae bacterium]